MRTMSGSPCLHYDCSNRNSFGYCNTTVCINEHYQQEQWGSPLTTNKSVSVVIKQQTNADRIRAMTDEELAKLFDGMIINCEGDVPCNRYCSSYWGTEITCEDAWLLWLKEEAKE